MSSPGPEWAAETGSTAPPEPPGGDVSASACGLPTSNKDEIEPQELLLLREFFLLLDQWDRQQER